MSWPNTAHSILSLMQKNPDRLFAMKAFLTYLIGWGSENWVTVPSWCGVYFTTNSKIALQGLLAAALISVVLVFRQQDNVEYKKSLVFLAMAIVMFLIIPGVYNIGLPWHANLPLIFL